MNLDVFAAPAAVALGGIVAGVLLATRGRRNSADIDRSRQTDVQQEYEQTLQQLRSLELEQGKLDPTLYATQRADLLRRAALALQRSEDPNMDAPFAAVRAHLETQREALGDAAVDAAIARLSTTEAVPKPTREPDSSGLSPAWMGALYALLGVAVVGGLYAFISGQTVERGAGAPMTGIDPSEMGGPPAAQGPAAPLPPEVQALQDRVAADSEDVEARNQLTEWAIGQQDLAMAMEQNGEVLRIDPTNPDGRVFRAYLMMSIGRTGEAIGMLEELLEEDPENIKASIYYGLMTLTSGDVDKAIPALERAIAAEPEGVEFLQERLAAARAQQAQGGAEADADGAGIAAGQLRLEPALAAALEPGDLLFISVRDPAGGPPLAAQRIEPAGFPLDFQLTGADRIQMGGDRPLPPLVDISFRIDRDGNAMTREEGLPSATVRGLPVGATELFVELTL